MNNETLKKYKLNIIFIPHINTNCYVITYEQNAILIDCAGDFNIIDDFFKKNNLNLIAILITHGHFDHIDGLNDAKNKFNDVSIFANIDEKVVIENKKNSLMSKNLNDNVLNDIKYIDENVNIKLLNLNIKMINTKGHTIGSCCYYIEDLKILFSGDTLFRNAYGRTDLPTGCIDDLIVSIKKKLFILPDDVIVYPGHGLRTQIGYEKKHFNLIY